MSFKDITLNALIIQHNRLPYCDLVERLDKDVFDNSSDDFDIEQSLKILASLTMRYAHNRSMFDILSKYVLDKFNAHRKSIDTNVVWTLQIGYRGGDYSFYKEERVTSFLIGLSVFGGQVKWKFLYHFSDEYQMYLEL